jgi:hypothetical protein
MTPVDNEVLHRRTTLLRPWRAATVLMVPSNPSKEVVMPVRVVATGRVVEAPIQLLGEDVWSAFGQSPAGWWALRGSSVPYSPLSMAAWSPVSTGLLRSAMDSSER